jgi:hypothetical protein
MLSTETGSIGFFEEQVARNAVTATARAVDIQHDARLGIRRCPPADRSGFSDAPHGTRCAPFVTRRALHRGLHVGGTAITVLLITARGRFDNSRASAFSASHLDNIFYRDSTGRVHVCRPSHAVTCFGRNKLASAKPTLTTDPSGSTVGIGRVTVNARSADLHKRGLVR